MDFDGHGQDPAVAGDAPARPIWPSSTADHVTISIAGLSANDAREAKRTLRAEAGVLWAHVSTDTEMAYVRYDPARTSPAALQTALEGGGLPLRTAVPLTRDATTTHAPQGVPKAPLIRATDIG